MATNDYVAESSGRWDAAGSWQDAVKEHRAQATKWARCLDIDQLREAIFTMANDVNAFTLYERRALLETVALILQ